MSSKGIGKDKLLDDNLEGKTHATIKKIKREENDVQNQIMAKL
jgi:hypothetical protein